MRKKDRKKAQKKKKSRTERLINTVVSVEPTPETVEKIEETERSATHDPNCAVCASGGKESVILSGDEKLYLIKNRVSRESRHVIAVDESELIEKIGWSKEDVLYAMIVKMIAARPMREVTKIRLRALSEKRREERKLDQGEIRRAREQKDYVDEVLLDGRIESRVKLRELTARSGSRTEKKEEVPMAVRTSTVKKTKTEPNISRKEPGQFVGSLGLSIFGHSVASVIRWMGKNNFSFDQAINALRHKNVSPLPRDRYIKHLLAWGKAGERGAPAALTSDEMTVLHNARNNGASKTKTATKTVTKAKTRSASKKRKK